MAGSSSHKDNQDLRNTGDGGWFYAENELFSVFAPLIGADGVAVYMAMCRLIPLASVDPDRPVTMRAIEDASTVSHSQANRKKEEIVRLGMVEEKRSSSRRPSTFRLVSLRALSLVGMAELRARLANPSGVPVRDTVAEAARPDTVLQTVHAAALLAAEDAAIGTDGLDESEEDEAPHRGAGEELVPRRDTGTDGSTKTLVEMLVSQKTASVSQNRASVSQNGGALKEEEEEEDSPLSPPDGGAGQEPATEAEAQQLREVNAMRARLKPPLPPHDLDSLRQGNKSAGRPGPVPLSPPGHGPGRDRRRRRPG